MNKLLRYFLGPPEWGSNDGHLKAEDIAQLAEGKVDSKKRAAFSAHLAKCAKCYELLEDTLTDMAEADTAGDFNIISRKSKTTVIYKYAIAASIMVCLMAGGIFLALQQPLSVVASLDLDVDLISVISENDNLDWTSDDRRNRLISLLKERGVPVNKIDNAKKVVMVAAYQPTKDIFGPEEVLKIRVEKGVIYLEVVKKEVTNEKNP